MQLSSDSFQHGRPIPAEFAMGAADGFGGNRNPHLAWREVPDGTRSFVLLCVDPDAPSDAALIGDPGVTIPVAHVRTDFVHWVMVDIPHTCRTLAAGECSDGVSIGGKRGPAGPDGARQGLNDYTGWFAGDRDMAGDYLGYDGPYPPANDLRPHRYFFRLFALDLPTLDLPTRFGAADVQRAMHGHVLAEALLYGTYSLHPGS